MTALQWRHYERDGASSHQPHHCLLRRLFGRKSKKTSKLRVTGLCAGIHRWLVKSPRRESVTRKMFPFAWWRHQKPSSTGCIRQIQGCHGFSVQNWNNISKPDDAYIRYQTVSSWVQSMGCRIFAAKPLPAPMLNWCQLKLGTKFSGFESAADLNPHAKLFFFRNSIEYVVTVRKMSTIMFKHQCDLMSVDMYQIIDNSVVR